MHPVPCPAQPPGIRLLTAGGQMFLQTMPWLRSLLGVGPSAAAPATQTPQGVEQQAGTPVVQPQPEPQQHAKQDVQQPQQPQPQELGLATPAAAPLKASPVTPEPPGPASDGEAEGEDWEEEGEENWYYGADVLRRGFRHTENQLAVWVVALLVAAVAINIGVSGGRAARLGRYACSVFSPRAAWLHG